MDDGARRGVTEPDGFDHLAGGQDLPGSLEDGMHVDEPGHKSSANERMT